MCKWKHVSILEEKKIIEKRVSKWNVLMSFVDSKKKKITTSRGNGNEQSEKCMTPNVW